MEISARNIIFSLCYRSFSERKVHTNGAINVQPKLSTCVRGNESSPACELDSLRVVHGCRNAFVDFDLLSPARAFFFG